MKEVTAVPENVVFKSFMKKTFLIRKCTVNVSKASSRLKKPPRPKQNIR